MLNKTNNSNLKRWTDSWRQVNIGQNLAYEDEHLTRLYNAVSSYYDNRKDKKEDNLSYCIRNLIEYHLKQSRIGLMDIIRTFNYLSPESKKDISPKLLSYIQEFKEIYNKTADKLQSLKPKVVKNKWGQRCDPYRKIEILEGILEKELKENQKTNPD
ncbi:hypothetical protein KY366_01885 [Candidatus Woesearchaeota archaeon]|nr:hypothetical protein [Candidatus Woesearchaeota archaeon]